VTEPNHAVTPIGTNVRSIGWFERAAKASLRLASYLPAGPASSLAYTLFFTPPPKRTPSKRAQRDLASGKRLEVLSEGRRVVAWSWGEGPTVYLLHGWGGLAAQMTSFVEPLVSTGHKVVALDGPAHGLSEGRTANLFTFAAALRALTEKEGEAHAVIAHSFGGAATAHAINRGLAVGRAVFLAAPSNPAAFLSEFLEGAGVAEKRRDAIRERMERRFGVRFDDLALPTFTSTFDVPLLVLHDADDREVPLRNGKEIAAAWPNALLQTTYGLGHDRILRDPLAVANAVDFITRAAASDRKGRRAAP